MLMAAHGAVPSPLALWVCILWTERTMACHGTWAWLGSGTTRTSLLRLALKLRQQPGTNCLQTCKRSKMLALHRLLLVKATSGQVISGLAISPPVSAERPVLNPPPSGQAHSPIPVSLKQVTNFWNSMLLSPSRMVTLVQSMAISQQLWAMVRQQWNSWVSGLQARRPATAQMVRGSVINWASSPSRLWMVALARVPMHSVAATGL